VAARVIAVVNQKGGACKTTVALNLAAALAETGAQVMLIDADPESHSASDWSTVRGDNNPPPFKLISMPQPILHRDVPGLAGEYDFVLIDGPPQSSPITKSAIAAADLVVIPVQPSGADHRATRETVKLIEESRAFKEKQKSVFLVTRRKAGTAIVAGIRKVLHDDYKLPQLRTEIPDRVAYAEAITKGTTIFEEQPRGPGPQDFRALLAEIKELMTDEQDRQNRSVSIRKPPTERRR
jgi:chromosome partitioning protein